MEPPLLPPRKELFESILQLNYYHPEVTSINNVRLILFNIIKY